MMEQHFKKLEELIKDDDKIVTVQSFACEANISIAESKETFDKYVEISHEIIKTYILNGQRKGESHLSISLVKEDNLQEQIELYKEGVYQTIFSIQKAKNIDFNVIALADSVGSMVEKYSILGAIIGTNCVKRTLRKKVLPTLPPATVKGKSTIFTKQNSTLKSESVKVDSNDDGCNQNNKNKGHTQNNIASLFNKAQSKKSDIKDIKQPEKKQKTNAGLSNFFTKQPSNELNTNGVKADKCQKGENSSLKDTEILQDFQINEEPLSIKLTHKEKEHASTQDNKHKKNNLFDSDTDDEILKDIEIKEEKRSEKKKEKPKAKAKGASSQKKKRGVNDVGNDKSVKKRKRIIVKDESDSDDIFGSEKSDSEDLIENSDQELEPVKAEKKPLPPKNKRRKAVDKTYEDEDGYIVTKTEYVYETPSEDENEPGNKIPKIEENPKAKIVKKGSSNSENDISPNKGAKSKKGTNKKAPAGNQPTLMNFFKKK